MWKCLHDDPQTSKLLKQIYGGSRPEIYYPTVNTVPRENLPAAFVPGSHEEQRTKDHQRKSPKKVRVPKFRGARSEGPAPIDSATMRRKSGAKIREEQAVNRERMDHYRPPYVKPVGEDEKSRLAEKFEFGGGKALPVEMTGPVMPIPSEQRWKASEAKRIAGVVRRRKGLPEDWLDPEGGGVETRGKRDKAQATTMFDQVANEIEERQRFLLDARESGGLPHESEARIMAEISQRMRELKRLTPSG